MSTNLQSEMKDFDKDAVKARKEAADIRKDGVGLLTPALMRKHLKSGQELILAYGRSGHTVAYSAEDLKRFASAISAANKQFAGHVKGVPLIALEQASMQVDKVRSKDISTATLYKVSGNLLYFRVPGKSKPHYQVRIRLEDWSRVISSPFASSLIAARTAALGRLSIDCECGRHQFWFRYLANIGGYDVTPPKEQDFPKIRNPNLKGCCCKHVLKVLSVLKSSTIHRALAKEIERQSKTVGFADGVKTRFLSQADLRTTSLARGVARTPKEARAAFKRFQREAAEFIEEAKGRKDVQEKKSVLKPRPARRIKPKEPQISFNAAAKGIIVAAAKAALEQGRSRDAVLKGLSKAFGTGVSSLDVILKEENL